MIASLLMIAQLAAGALNGEAAGITKTSLEFAIGISTNSPRDRDRLLLVDVDSSLAVVAKTVGGDRADVHLKAGRPFKSIRSDKAIVCPPGRTLRQNCGVVDNGILFRIGSIKPRGSGYAVEVIRLANVGTPDHPASAGETIILALEKRGGAWFVVQVLGGAVG